LISHYSVIRYVPDPISEEVINIGLVAYDENKIEFNFLNNWNRVRSFSSNGNISFLQDFVNETERWTKEEFLNAQKNWSHSIQFSDSRPSSKPVETVLQNMANVFLHEKIRKSTLGKKRIMSIVAEEMNMILDQYRTDSKKLVHRYYTINGRSSEHVFDLAIANGIPYVATFTIPMDILQSRLKQINKEIDASAFAIEDVQRNQSNIKTAVITSSSNPENVAFRRAMKIFKDLNSPLVKNEEISAWMTKTISQIPELIS